MKIIGVLLLILAFAIIVSFMTKLIGWKVTLFIWGGALALTTIIYVGAYLICK